MLMSERPDVTRILSDLVAKSLTSQNAYWAAEVNFDKNTSAERRIDFVGFKPCTPDYVVEPTSVELGTFSCYEVKSGRADFTSGHGLTFYGDENYLVCTVEFAEELQYRNMQEGLKMPMNLNAILCPDKTGSRLYQKYKVSDWTWSKPHRKRPASELLWAICQSHDSQRAGMYRYES